MQIFSKYILYMCVFIYTKYSMCVCAVYIYM